jgi:hypothetical protein
LLLILLAAGAPFPAHAEEAFDLTIIQNGTGCAWTGSVDLEDLVFSPGCDATFTGTMSLDRVPGAAPGCPAVVSGDVSGNASGSDITFGLSSGSFGNVNFTGTITTTPSGESVSGTWSGDPGTGTWFALNFAGFGRGAANLLMTKPVAPCSWTGPISGTGAVTLEGSMALGRVSGADPCPETVSGPVTGKLFGNAICFEVESLEFGDLTFIGTVNRQSYTGSGTWSGDQAGEGTWTVIFPRAVGSPLVGEAGLALILALLLAAGVQSLKRRPN